MRHVHEPTPGVVPIHHQIADALRERIFSGELAAGAAMPSVSELCAAWNCSPGSARSALTVLKGEGLITGGRGKPATVRTPPVRVKLTLSMSQRIKELVLRPEHERAATGTLELTAGLPINQVYFSHRYSRISANAELAEEFSLPEGSELLRREYEMTDRDAGRISWSISYIPVRLIEGNLALLDERNEPWPGGHQHQLYTVGIEIDRFDRIVSAVEPSPGERQKWKIDTGVPLLFVRSRSIDITGRVVELSDATYPADRTELVFTEVLDRWPADHPRYGENTTGDPR